MGESWTGRDHLGAVGSQRAKGTFPALARRVLGQIADCRVVAFGDFGEFVGPLLTESPATVVGTVDELVVALDHSAAPTVFVPPIGSREEFREVWQALEGRSQLRALVVPCGDLSHALPRRLVPLGNPALVIEGSVDGPGVRVGVRLALVLLRLPHSDGLTRFFSAEGAGEEETDLLVQDLERLLSQGGGSTKFGYVVREELPAGASLAFSERDPTRLTKVRDLAQFGSGAVVRDAFSVLRARPRRDRPPVSEPVRVLGGRDVSSAGEILPPDEADPSARSKPTMLDVVSLEVGDLLVREVERLNIVATPAEVQESDLPLAAGAGLIVLRPRSELSRDELEFYKLYLASARCREVMRTNRLAGFRRLAGIGSTPLPVPDEPLLEALHELRTSRVELGNWAAESENLMHGVFEGSATEARDRLIQAGRQLRQRAEAAAQVGSLDHRISNFYPLPIAQQWRAVRTAETAGNDADTYKAILDAFESTMAYGAALALAFAQFHGISVGAMQEIGRKLAQGNGGTSLGDWVNIQKEISTSKAFRKLDSTVTLASVRALLAEGTEVAEAQERLSKRRNDEAHQRGVEPADLPASNQVAMADLKVILDNLAFLADIPLLHVKQVDWDAFSGTGLVTAQQLRGDHPMCPTVTFPCKESGIERNSLYVQDLSGKLVLLRPFLVRVECPTCRTWRVFHPDRMEQHGVILKAIDHSHTTSGAPYLSALRAVGYIREVKGDKA